MWKLLLALVACAPSGSPLDAASGIPDAAPFQVTETTRIELYGKDTFTFAWQ